MVQLTVENSYSYVISKDVVSFHSTNFHGYLIIKFARNMYFRLLYINVKSFWKLLKKNPQFSINTP